MRMKIATLMVIRRRVKNRGEPACVIVLAGAAGTESLPHRGQVRTEAAIKPRHAWHITNLFLPPNITTPKDQAIIGLQFERWP